MARAHLAAPVPGRALERLRVSPRAARPPPGGRARLSARRLLLRLDALQPLRAHTGDARQRVAPKLHSLPHEHTPPVPRLRPLDRRKALPARLTSADAANRAAS